VIGSADGRWDRPALAAADYDGHLPAYLRQLVNFGNGREFAPRPL
jgi:hypothetical protein